jgi:phosphate-selective porin OprO/OprP
VIHYTRQIVFVAVSALAAVAQAQPAPTPAPAGAAEPAPGAPAPAESPATSVAPETPPAVSVPAPSPADTARIDEIDQAARIALRKHELLDEEAAKRAKEAPKLGVGEQRFLIELPDKSYVLKFHALVQADGRFFVHNDALQANDTFLIRRFRPSLDGTLFSIADFKLVPELAGTVQVLDAYVDMHPREWLRLRVGKFKVPIGLERLQSDADLPLIERGLDQNLSSTRDIGVQLWGDIAGGIVHYAIGIFNGDPDTTSADNDIDHAKDIAARLFFRPFKTDSLRDFGNLGVGIAVESGNRKGRLPTATAAAQTGLVPSFRTSGQSSFFQYQAPATDTTGALTTFTHERTTRVNPQLYYYYGPFGLLAEYLWVKQGVQRGSATAELTQQGAHATLSYTIGGTDGYEGATPEHNFEPAKGQWGALQLAARYGWVGFDDATFPVYANPVASVRSAQAFAGGVNWILQRSVRFAVNYEQVLFEGGAGTAASGMNPAVVADRLTEYLLLGRAQVNF